MAYDYTNCKPSECCALNDGCARPAFCNTFGYACGDPDAPKLTPELSEKIEREIETRHLER